ncbi:hypothetical protein CHRY9390_00060 [Chryseobacterium aquaeductus]|uniref:Uncharacterized protein n=1 Tax=Chryseobacterium aquaeductus TaxID=2675056 RepID=A0A9N8MDE4_9FLAO|nr:hypothetical protein [Chryseobacterium aquaeductus]CAA7329424.1 hypothetical protein CHRY9390_00060 [Chryseobacterium potabilaquae]CAD7796797.1 hypothetical protein CHRY9390_00060 [Chryseobacterium aquaeductus]
MKKKCKLFILAVIPNLFFSQVVMTDKATPLLDQTAALKLDSDTKGLLLPRIGLGSNVDITTVASPQNGNIVFNTNPTASLPQTVAYFDAGKWNALPTKNQIESKLDLVNTSSISSAGNIVVTGFTPGSINLGSGTANWTSLGITDSKSFTRTNNSFAFTLEGMAQLDKSVDEYFEYAIGIFVDDQLVVVRKYHKQRENFTCSWHKFVLNGVVNNLSVGNHTIKVMARNISSTSNSSTQSIVYGGIAQSSNTGNPPCGNVTNFLSKISLSTTIVETLN